MYEQFLNILAMHADIAEYDWTISYNSQVLQHKKSI